jgi:hypothetical protein
VWACQKCKKDGPICAARVVGGIDNGPRSVKDGRRSGMATGDFCSSTVVTVKVLRSANGEGGLLRKTILSVGPRNVG